MLGQMQDIPLNCSTVLDHAALQHSRREIISYDANNAITRSDYSTLRARALCVSQCLSREGVVLGDRIATLASSTLEHLEAWYGAVGIGAIYHPINPRLHIDQIAHIFNEAEDRILFADAPFAPLLGELADRLPSLKRIIFFTRGTEMPQVKLRNIVDYESWLSQADGDMRWRPIAENSAAALLNTSGTTGLPKGVLYSHRSIVLMSLTVNARDMYGFSAHDVVLMAVPMFHANGWSWPFTAPMAGAALVLPGPRLDPESLVGMITANGVTISGGVPTVWQNVLQHVERTDGQLPSLRRLYIGGAPCPEALLTAFQRRHVEIQHVWGMTEMGPTGSVCASTPETRDHSPAALQLRQGRAPFLVEMKLTDDHGTELPWDGRTPGRLLVRGPCVLRRYYRANADATDGEGFFDTGDIASIDENGFMQITDRAKDLIKSGGEWISSVEIEAAALSYSPILEAAAIAAEHPKWGERPILVIALKAEHSITVAELKAHLAKKMPRWQLPDDIVVVEDMPHTATGKIDKMWLRKQYHSHLMLTLCAPIK